MNRKWRKTFLSQIYYYIVYAVDAETKLLLYIFIHITLFGMKAGSVIFCVYESEVFFTFLQNFLKIVDANTPDLYLSI